MRFSCHSACDARDVGDRQRVPRVMVRAVFFALSISVFILPLAAQDVERQERELLGAGSVITVKIHDASGGTLSSDAVVKLFRGVYPSGQRETSSGVAEFVVTNLGEFTVVVSAPGYAESQKDVTVNITGRAQVDVYLRRNSPAGTVENVPGRPVLTPKAKEDLNKGLHALKADKLHEAEKYIAEALRLAPANPDVLYLQGVLELRKRDWQQAQTVLEKATQIDPSSSAAFAALGMALCNAGKYDAAVSPLEKSLQLDPTGTWQTRWALARSYYQRHQFDEALKLSQQALTQSSGNEPQVTLLLAQSFTAVGRYEDAAHTLREFLKDHGDGPESTTAHRWLDQLAASGKIHAN